MRTCIVCLFIVLGGCAVTKIDVDVYKGPMANHADVQTEQLTALAMAAKPLLVGLRDKLEGITVDERNRVTSADGRKGDWDYAPDFMAPNISPGPGDQWFKNPQAIRVNTLLSLYKDKASEDLQPFLVEGRQYLAVYREEWRKFTPDEERDKARWNKFHKHMRRENDKQRAFKAFLVPAGSRTRDPRGLISNLNSRIDEENKVKAAKDKIPPIDLNRANAAYLALQANPKRLRDDAKDVFESGTSEAEIHEFVQEVVSTARAFINARSAVERLFLLTLRFQEYLESDDFHTRGPESQRLRDAASRLTAKLVVRTALLDALTAPRLELLKLRTRLERSLGTEFFKTFDPIEERKAILAEALRAQLVISPGPAARELGEVHDWFKTGYARTGTSFEKQATRQFGLARIAPEGEEEQTGFEVPLFTADELESIIGKGFFESGGGLEQGRLTTGLETLIEQYLEATRAERAVGAAPASNELTPENLKRLQARKDLMDSLVHFSEKVLFIADNQQILREASSNPADVETYAAVLQTVGNSILVAADELRNFADYMDSTRRARRATVQKRGISSAYPTSPNTVFEEVVDLLKNHKGKIESGVAEAETVNKTAQAKYLDLLARSQVCKMETADAARDVTEKQLASSQAINRAALYVKARDIITTDRAFLDKRGVVLTANPPPKYSDVLQQFFVVVRDLRGIEVQEHGQSPRAVNLKATEDALEELSKLSSSASSKPPLVRLMDEFEAAQTAAGEAASVAQKAVDKQAAVQNRCAGVPDELRATEAAKNATEAELKNKQKDLEKRFKDVKERLKSMCAEICNIPSPTTRAVVIASIIAKFEKNKQPATTQPVAKTAEEQLAADALAMLNDIKNLDEMPSVGSGEDERDVIDQVTVGLRYKHIDAVRMYGKDHPLSKNLEEAIHQAETYRSGMVYIRPPSAYLRTSNTSAFLQRGGANTRWENMLAGQAFRSVPLLGESLTNSEGYKKHKLLADADKQFWQNINQVRVAAVGITNYVIAKDDIGNWYVKNYSGDPEKIIKAAQAVTLYGASARLGVNLVQRNDDQEKAARGEAVDNKTSTSIVDRQVSQFRANYITQTNDDAAKIRLFVAGAVGAIKADIDNNDVTKPQNTPLKAAIDKAASSLSISIPAKPDAATDTALGNEIIDTLRSVRSFGSQSAAEIDRLKLEDSMTVEGGKTLANLRTARDVSEQNRLAAESKLQNLTQTARDARDKRDLAAPAVHEKYEALCVAEKALAREQGVANNAIAIGAAQTEVVQKKHDYETAVANKALLDGVYTEAETAAGTQKLELLTLTTAAAADKKAYDDGLRKARDIIAAAKKAVSKTIDARLNELTDMRLNNIKAYSDAIMVVRQSVSSTPAAK